MVSAAPQAVEMCVVGHHRKYAFSLSLICDWHVIVIDRCRTKLHSSIILQMPSRKRKYEFTQDRWGIFALKHYSKLTLFAGIISSNISAKIKTTI